MLESSDPLAAFGERCFHSKRRHAGFAVGAVVGVEDVVERAVGHALRGGAKI
jgi:hypothetical protein